MKKKALTLTEVIIALSVGLAIMVPTSYMFANSNKQLEKSSNLIFAAGLARTIISSMMSNHTIFPQVGNNTFISCCDDSSDNVYFRYLFNLKENCGNLKKGLLKIGKATSPKFYHRIAKYDFRYGITLAQIDESVKSVAVYITWKEFGVNKNYETHAFIVAR